MTLKSRNKSRVYLAFYIRGSSTSGIPFHTALLLAPKSKPVCTSSGVLCAKYDATNLLGEDKIVAWRFRAQDFPARAPTLAALLLVGKTSAAAAKVQRVLERVPVVQDDPDWRCSQWVWAALEILAAKGFIAPLSARPESVWQHGMDFASAQRLDYALPVPTCDAFGNVISSEIGPLES